MNSLPTKDILLLYINDNKGTRKVVNLSDVEKVKVSSSKTHIIFMKNREYHEVTNYSSFADQLTAYLGGSDVLPSADSITFVDYQEGTKDTAFLYLDACKKHGIPPWVYVALGLAGEAGEICNKLKKIIRDKDSLEIDDELRGIVEKEIGDELWYLTQLAETFDLKLSTIASKNLSKLKSRKDRGVLGGSGDTR